MEIIFTASEISQRIIEMGREITGFYQRQELTIVALMNGALPFAADLVRAIDLDCYVDSISVASYHNCQSSGKLELRSKMKLSPYGRQLLLVDEVLDSGITLQAVSEYFRNQGASSVRTAVLVEKQLPRLQGLTHADWTGFTTPDRYLVGYGLDANEHYRNLPYIATLE